jgi:thymidylate kinase
MYICLEGIKGSGKTTAFELLKKKLDERCLSYSVLCPTKPISGFNIREWIHCRFSFSPENETGGIAGSTR